MLLRFFFFYLNSSLPRMTRISVPLLHVRIWVRLQLSRKIHAGFLLAHCSGLLTHSKRASHQSHASAGWDRYPHDVGDLGRRRL